MKQRADKRGGHAGGGHDHAAARRVRMAQALEAHDKQNGGEQVSCFKYVGADPFLASAFTGSFLRNILSMRSVIRKPPVTLMVAEVTAIHPRIVLSSKCLLRPASTSQPPTNLPAI